MKKVILLGPAHPFRGGLASFNERLAQAFLDAGHSVQVVTFTTQYPNFLFPGKTQFTDAPPPQQFPILRRLSSIQPLSWWHTGRWLAHQQADILIPAFWLPFMGPSLGTASLLAHRNGKTRNIALVHNMIPHEHRPGDRLLSAYFVRQMDGFVSLSQSVLDDVRRFTATKPVAWYPHPVYDQYGPRIEKQSACHQLGLDPTYRYVLFFGFIRQYKGLDLLLEAFRQSPLMDIPDVRLLIAGEFYEEESSYQSLLQSPDLQGRVVAHTHYISDESVAAYFSVADLVAQPYRSATQSGVAQIAYHFEVPMVVTNVGGLPEIVTHRKAGWVVEPTAADISVGIASAMDPDTLATLQSGVIEEKQRFSWEGLVDTFLSVAEQA